MTNKYLVTAAALAVSALLSSSVLAAEPAPADKVISTAPAGQAVPPAPPAPPAAGPQGFGPGQGPDVALDARRMGPPAPGARPGDGRPGPRPGFGPDVRPIIVAPAGPGYAPAYAGWDCPRYDGYCPRYDGRVPAPNDVRPAPRGYRGAVLDALNDERYADLTTEIAKLEDLLYVERNVLRGMQQQTDVKSSDLRTQARNVVELKNQLDAKYDELMTKYREDNGDVYQDSAPRRGGHHPMRHHRWHHWE